MACTYTGSLEGDARLSVQEAYEELDQLERMLCAVCTQMEENIGQPFTQTILRGAQAKMEPGDPSLREWWVAHKRTDAQRKG